MFEAVVSGYRWFFLQLADLVGIGWGIVALSFITSAAMMPLMKAVAGIVKRESEYQSVILPQLAQIKSKFSTDAERHMHIQRLYARYGYSPLSAVKKVLPLFVQIPFLLLTYYMLKGTAEINGVSFLFLRDLGQPDGLIGHLHINLLPFVMTMVNVVTIFATPSFTRRDCNQAIVVALIFLALLYVAPSALLLYWTLNNIISFVKVLFPDHIAGVRLLASRVKRMVRCLNPIVVAKRIEWPKMSWRTPLVVLRNYAILMLIVFLPAMVLIFGHMPDRLDLDICSNKPLCARAGFIVKDVDGSESIAGEIVQGCPLGDRKDPLSFFFADGCNPGLLRIGFSGSEYDYKVISLHLVKHLLFNYELTFDLKDNVLLCKGQPKFNRVEFPIVKGSLLMLKVGLFGLLLVAVLGLFVKKTGKVTLEWRLSLAMAILGAVFFSVILPLQTVIGNRDVFNYPLSEVVCQDAVVFLITLLSFFIILSVSSIAFGRWPHVIFLAIFVYEYLQTGVLSLNAPVMDGNMNYYWRTGPMLVDFGVMVVIGISVLAFSTWVRHHFRQLVMICMFGIGVLCIFIIYDVFADTKELRKEPTKNETPWCFQRNQVVKNLKYSSAGNVIVLVLDSTQSDAAYNAALVDTELRSAFDGFTAFNNNVGMHDNTRSGSVGLFTGEYYFKDVPIGRHYAKCYGESSFVTPYVEADYPVYILPGILGAFSNRMENKREASLRLGSSSVFLRREKPMNTSVLDVLQLRLVPFFLKKWDLQIMYLGSIVADGTYEEHSLYPELANCGIATESKPALIYLHTEGTHAPIRYDEFGNRLWADKDNYRGLCGETHYIMKSVAGYMRDLKRLGVYDNSMIVITADHGCCFDAPQLPKLRKLPTRAVPMLWIKPVGAHGALEQTEVPTSHSKIAKLLCNSKDEELTIDGIIDILRTEVRRFRYDEEGLVDWYIDANGNPITE